MHAGAAISWCWLQQTSGTSVVHLYGSTGSFLAGSRASWLTEHGLVDVHHLQATIRSPRDGCWHQTWCRQLLLWLLQLPPHSTLVHEGVCQGLCTLFLVLLVGVAPLNYHGGACTRPHKLAIEGLKGSSSLAVVRKYHEATPLRVQ